jgi:hypothetical protein
LKIYIIEARELATLEASKMVNAFAQMRLADQETRSRIIPNTLKPQWNDIYNLYFLSETIDSEVEDASQTLSVEICDEQPGTEPVVLGKCEVSVPDERTDDQAMQIMWKVLHDGQNKATTGRLRLGVQYIFDLVRLKDAEIRAEQGNLAQTEAELTTLLESSSRVCSTDPQVNLGPFDVIVSQGRDPFRRNPTSIPKRDSPLKQRLSELVEKRAEAEAEAVPKVAPVIMGGFIVPNAAAKSSGVFFALALLAVVSHNDFVNV